MRFPRFKDPVRLGIAGWLTIAFGAVAALALAANLIVEHGVSIVRTVEVRPVIRPAPVTLPTDSFTSAIQQFGRSVLGRTDEDSPRRRRELSEAMRELQSRTVTFLGESEGVVSRRGLDTLRSRALAHEQQAKELVRLADTRRHVYKQGWDLFEALDFRVKAAVDSALKVFGRVLARRSLLALSHQLDGMRRGLTRLATPDGYNQATIDDTAASESTFAALLEQNAPGLTRSQGDDWVRQVREDFARLASIRISLVQSDQQRRGAIDRFSKANRALAALARAEASRVASSGQPDSTASLPEPTITTTSTFTEDHRQRMLMAGLSMAVLALLLGISIATVISISRPVRRLMTATERLARGEPQVTVPRGGIKELDTLAVSFNQMAQRLAEAQAIAREYQGQLEAKVVERTRQLQHLAEHDPLTELPNRRQLFEQLNGAIRVAVQQGNHVGVFFLDLDNFKNINDSMGHALGDRVLESMAERLREEVGSSGFAARLGGDEFTVIATGVADIEEICNIGEALVRAFQRPLAVDGRELSLGISVGASFFPEHGEDAETLLRAADAALFRAKALGRSQLSVFSPELLDAAASKFATEQGLRRAVERGEFELVFQPEVNADTFQIDVMEALLRWRLPDGRLAPPGEFLAVAEESNLIVEISDWVLRAAIDTAAKWHHDGSWPGARIAINVSARQLLNDRFLENVEDLLKQNRLPADRIEIELTEHVLQTGHGTVEALRRIRACGIGVALDDFGAGYSSLASLERLPLTRAKLDRSLIASIDHSARSLAIARAITDLCHSLGLQVTAEGIERPEQFAALLACRPLCVQGYLLSRPIAADEVISEHARMPARMRSLLRQAQERPSQRRRAV
jgi:diguanylate cyclase (GGDEF)-like protein